MANHFKRMLLAGLLMACAPVMADSPRWITPQDKQRVRQGWLAIDQIKLAEVLTELPTVTSEPIGAAAVPPDWNYATAPSTTVGAARPAQANRPRVIHTPRLFDGEVQYLFSSPAPKRMLAFECGFANFGENMLLSPMILRIFDTASGAQVGKVRVPNGYRPVALSEDGSRVLVQWLWKQIRLDVYDTHTGRHIAGWQPYVEPPDKSNYRYYREQQGLGWARFVDNDNVVTLNQSNTLCLWKLPTCERTYEFTGVQMPFGACFTPDGQSVITHTGCIFHLSDGKVLGKLENFRPFTSQLAVSPDGTQLAGSVRFNESSTLMIWNLSTGKLVASRSEHPARQPRRIWCDEQYMLEDGMLKAVQTGRFVWAYEDKTVDAMVNGLCWFPRRESLVGLHLPDPATLKAIDDHIGQLAKPLISPGMTVQIDAAFDGPSQNREKYKSDVQQLLTDRMSKGGLIVADKGQATLRVTTENGEDIVYGKGLFGINGQFSLPQLLCKVTWMNDKGEQLWQNQCFYYTDHYVGRDDDEQKVKQYLLEARWSLAKDYLSGLTVPTTVYPTVGSGFDQRPAVLGKSAISDLGEVTTKVIDKPQ